MGTKLMVKTNKALTASNLNDTIRGVTHKGICRKVRESKTIPPLLFRQLRTDVVVNFMHIYITCKPGSISWAFFLFLKNL